MASEGRKYPSELYDQWNLDANGVSLDDVSALTSRYAWVCPLGHEFVAPLRDRLDRGRGCPYCAGKKVLVGFNDIETTHPDMAAMWDYERNVVSPREVSAGSAKVFWWKCTNGLDHSFQAACYRVKSGRGCSVCAGKVVTSSNSLASVRPDVAKYLHPDLNGFSADEITCGSSRKAYWFDDLGHVYVKTVKARVSGSACPYCSPSNTQILSGFNDLATRFPEVAAQWDHERNEITPSEVLGASGRSYWWVCEKGHSWICSVDNRTLRGAGCPQCSGVGFSKGEKEVVEFIRNNLPDGVEVLENVSGLVSGRGEVDIYIPDRRVAVEFNGLYWHSEQAGKGGNYHYDKWKACRDKGVQLITVWEDDWKAKRPLVESMLLHKIGASNSVRVFARSTVVVDVAQSRSREFFDRNHLQGFKPGCRCLGLQDKDSRLVAALSYRVRGKACVIERFATSVTVPGGFSRLLKHLKERCITQGVVRIETFSDHDISDGTLYRSIGFDFAGVSLGNYWYAKTDGTMGRKHRSGFTKASFRNHKDLLYEDGLTERELADLNGLCRIYGSGNDKWVLHLGSVG